MCHIISVIIIILLHRLHAVHRCGLLLQMWHVAWFVCCVSVCLSGHTGELCKKTAVPIKTPLGGWLLGPRNHVLQGCRFPIGRGFLGGYVLVRCNITTAGDCTCTVHVADECIRHRERWKLKRQRCNLLPNYFGHILLSLLLLLFLKCKD